MTSLALLWRATLTWIYSRQVRRDMFPPAAEHSRQIVDLEVRGRIEPYGYITRLRLPGRLSAIDGCGC